MTVLDLHNRNKQLNIDGLDSLSVSVCLGCFDGVHLGHAALLQAACAAAERTAAAPAVWTFLNPPFPGRAKQLTGLSEKLSLFASYGIRYVFLYDFDEVRSLSPEAFVRDILIGECHTAACVCGFNFRFAKDAAGTSGMLRTLLASYGCTLDIVPAVTVDGVTVSATRIRSLLSEGDIAAAARCLGRPYSFTLPVVHGKELGRTIGVPTVNQNPPQDMQIPASGTYATTVSVDGVPYPAVTNIGIRPSIQGDDHIPNAETHIIGYRGWLYDKPVTVSFRHRLRDEIRFPSLDALKEQIMRDIAASAASFST